jgi:predicted membrane-bound spermidine synthase
LGLGLVMSAFLRAGSRSAYRRNGKISGRKGLTQRLRNLHPALSALSDRLNATLSGQFTRLAEALSPTLFLMEASRSFLTGAPKSSSSEPNGQSNLRLWAIAFAEGFSTLAAEVIVIRLAVPIAGSSMTLTGVMLGVILLALSAGYWHGGLLSARGNRSSHLRILTRNLFLAAIVYAAAFPLEAMLLEKLLDRGWGLEVAIFATATVLFALPVYLVAQSVPLITELTGEEGKGGKASGKVLFYSTLGSVAGGIGTPILLFPYAGVRASAYMVCGLLFVTSAVAAVGAVQRVATVASGVAILAAVSLLRIASIPADERFLFDSPHQTFRIVERPAGNGRLERVMFLNGGAASGIYADSGESSFPYIREAGRALEAVGGEYVLAVGAAGFTFPRDAAAMPGVERIDAVDVDPAVLEVAEHQFLRAALPAKVRFLAISARYALKRFRAQGVSYDFTLLDAYSGKAIPDELLTSEFLSDVKAVSKRTVANVILDHDAESSFATNALATFRSVFGRVWIKDVNPGDSDLTNYLVSSWEMPGSHEWRGSGLIYTDNRENANREHVRMVWGND